MRYKKKYPVWGISLYMHGGAIYTVHHSVKESFEKKTGMKMLTMRFDKKTYDSFKEKGTIVLKYGMMPKIEIPKVEIKKDFLVNCTYGFKIRQPSLLALGCVS